MALGIALGVAIETLMLSMGGELPIASAYDFSMGGELPIAKRGGLMGKARIDAFLLECQNDDKIKLVEAEFGLKGFAIVVKLLQKIYGGNGYYCEWNNDIVLLFSDEVNENCNLVSMILNASIKRGIFSQEMLQKQGILTSKDIQIKYFDVVKRRIEVSAKKEYLLLSVDKIKANVNIIEENVCRNEENACRNDTSKVKESKYLYILKRPEDAIYSNSELETTFRLYLSYRKNNGMTVTKEQIALLAEELDGLSDSDKEKIAIIKKAITKGWKGFYPIKTPGVKKQVKSKSSSNFEPRKYDMTDLERKLLQNK